MTGFDLTETIAPRSDQQNADDYVAGPKTVKITEVRRGTTEQPVEVHLAEFPGRPYKPSKSMRRVMVAAWGADASAYVGKRLTLYTDPEVKFGGATVGGIKISAMSDLKKPLQLALTTTRGKRATHVVKPLADEPKPTAKILPVESVTPTQLTEINDGLTALGINDRDVKLATVCQVIGREIESAKHLTPAEAVTVLDWIGAEQAVDLEPASATGNSADGSPVTDWPETATIPGTEGAR